MARPDEYGERGLSKVAHAIRRSSALYVAMHLTPPESSIEEMLGTADRLAGWLAGKAGQQESSPDSPPPLGKAWPPED